jgi:hypothetical protein
VHVKGENPRGGLKRGAEGRGGGEVVSKEPNETLARRKDEKQ